MNDTTSFDYETLTVEHKQAMILNRLMQLEQEHFGHVLNRRLLEESGDRNESTAAAIADLDDTMGVIEAAIGTLKKFREQLSNGQGAAPGAHDDDPGSAS